MTYKLIDLARNKQSTEYSSQFEAISGALALTQKYTWLNDPNIHLSVVDSRNRQLLDIKIRQREEAKMK
jgi:hypothetical protein